MNFGKGKSPIACLIIGKASMVGRVKQTSQRRSRTDYWTNQLINI
jgi:23S rRNA A1618 N6-methylase RlmF